MQRAFDPSAPNPENSPELAGWWLGEVRIRKTHREMPRFANPATGMTHDFDASAQVRSRSGSWREFASIVARLRSRGIKIIPVTGSGIGRKHLQADGIHLTAEGHTFLAARLLPSVVAALGR